MDAGVCLFRGWLAGCLAVLRTLCRHLQSVRPAKKKPARGGLPRRNEWVFASTRALKMDARNVKRRQRDANDAGREAPDGDIAPASATGHLTDPSAAHRCACATAGLEGLTLHGLRRSFASLTEWLEVPTGVVA